MATVLLLTTVVVLFGGWIWTLKQEMRVIRGRLAPPEAPKPEATRAIESETVNERIHQRRTELRPAPVPVTGNGVRVQRGYNGVQTFVIDS